MSNSNYQFERWEAKAKTSWEWRIYKKHTIEFQRMYSTFDTGKKFTYQSLKANDAELKDDISEHFTFEYPWESKNFGNLGDWISGFNDLENWINLNALVTVSSNLETYMSTIISLALKSDIGVLYGTSHRIDGIEILKHSKDKPFNFKDIIISCTKGTWESRASAYESTFGKVPEELKKNISDLDKMRVLRNNIAHAFGREIETTRVNGIVHPIPIIRLSRQKLLKWQGIIWKTTKAIDNHLLNDHIGEYPALLYYHELYPTLNHTVHPSMRAIQFMKSIGGYGIESQGKEFSKGLVAYYEAF